MNMEYEQPLQRRTANTGTSQPTRRKSTGKGGRYLKEPTSKRQNHSRYGSRRRRRKLNPRFVILIVGLLAIIMGIILCVRSCTKPTLVGRWDLDGTTVYEFGKDGKGALVLMNTEYEFHYVIEDNLLRIDFVDEAALDANYTFEVDKAVLFLTGGPGDAKMDFALQRIGS